MRFNLGFFLREAFKNMRLNPLMSITAVTTTALCLLILGAGILVGAHVQGMIRQIGEGVQITAFLPENATPEQVDEAKKTVEAYPEVAEYTYVSKEEALRRLRSNFEEQPEVVDGIGSEFLPPSLEIKLNQPQDSEVVAQKLRADGIEDLRYPQQTIDRLNSVTAYIIWGLRVATALFLVASVLLIFNAIRLSIFARRKEIEVMKLVGASDGFVRWPFVIEGLVQGLIGATIAAVAVLWANALFVEWVTDPGGNLAFLPIAGDAANGLLVFAVLVSVGAAVGVFGSYFSVRRYLKI